MFIDTHTHLFSDKFDQDIDHVITRAIDQDVLKMFLPNIDSSTTEAMKALAAKYPDHCYPMIGLHPCSVKENFKSELDHIEKELADTKYYGIGETGIDLHWDTTFKAEQIEAFRYQIDLAKMHDLPIVIHSRDCLDLTIDIITELQDGNLKGIFHCFNGNIDQCQKIQDVGFMMGLGGVVTYKGAKLSEVVAYMSSEHLLLETDAPYLAPTPHRGKRNESAFIIHIAEKIAEYRACTLAEIQNISTNNAKKLFAIS